MLRDRVELMSVAAGTLNCQPENRRAENLHFIGDDFQTVRHEVRDVGKRPIGCRPQKTCRDQAVVNLRRDLLRVFVIHQLVAGDLFLQKPVVRLVGIERADDVIAVPPDVRPHAILVLSPLRIRVAGRVEPVPRPPLAVPRRIQQPINQPLPRSRFCVGKKFVLLLNRRRQPSEVKADSPQKREPIRPFCESQPVLVEPSFDERIDWVCDTTPDLWNRHGLR